MNEQSKVEELLNIAPYEESIESEKAFTEALQEELIFHYENKRASVIGKALILTMEYSLLVIFLLLL